MTLRRAVILNILPVSILVNTFVRPTAQAHPLNPIEDLDSVLLTAKQDDFDFSGDGRSGNRIGGGSRSDCPSVEIPLTALVPGSNWGKTLSGQPTFWFYVPYTPEQAPIGEFVFQDEDRNDIYRVEFTLPTTPGFVSVTLPETRVSLAVNQWHRWYFNLYCDRQKSSSPVFVRGWVQRIAPNPELNRELDQATSRQDKVYAAHGIWFDAIAHLANWRLANPTALALNQDWSEIFQARGVELELPNQEPLVGSVNFR